MSRAWFPFYVGDYLRDTSNLSTTDHGAYLLLILYYWQHGGLPDDEEELATIARMLEPEWAKARKRLSRFFYDGWKHKRVELELAKAEEKYAKRAEAGKRGGNAKAASKQYSSKPPSNANHNEGSNALAKSYQPHSKLDSSSRTEADVPREEIRENPPVRRVETSPSDPVLQRPNDPLAAYSEAELKSLIFEFDGVDVESAIHELDRWATKRGITDLIERKNAIYGAIRKRHGKAKLLDSMESPEVATVSPQLAASRMTQKFTMDDAGKHPEFLRRNPIELERKTG